MGFQDNYSLRRDLVCVEPFVVKERLRKGSIIIPDTIQSQLAPQQGRVISCGPRVNSVRPGDTVLYGLGTGHEVHVDEHKYVILGENQLICTVEPN